MTRHTNTCTLGDPAFLLTRNTAARYLAISVRTLFTLTQAKKIPCVRITDRCVRYRREDLDAYVATRLRGGK